MAPWDRLRRLRVRDLAFGIRRAQYRCWCGGVPADRIISTRTGMYDRRSKDLAKLNLKAVEQRVGSLGGRESYNREFIFELLLAYGKPKGNVTRLQRGSLNVAADPACEVAQKNVVYFRETTGDPLADVEELRTSPTVVRYSPRFVIATNFDELVAVDMKTGENLMIPIRDIDKHFTFFLPWAGMEKAQYVGEAHADVKAAERMGKLFDELLSANPELLDLPHGRHALNVFFTRLLFCFFAEDTGIFDDGQFTHAVGSHTQANGSDVSDFLTDVFTALDTPKSEDKPTYLSDFPYVNGRLFSVSDDHVVPSFTKRARELLIELGTLIWREINPDIFGSMFQAIVTPGKRSDLGQHYTSVPNILKTIEPLFLDSLKEEFDSGFHSVKKLETLLGRISGIKVFDPACGSGNFLIIAYKELRRLEHAILERLAALDNKHQVLYAESKINIENFYGIEIDDFAVEVAILSLWIAKHQMNAEFKDKFGVSIPLIPLKETGQIREGNATRVDWEAVCPKDGESESFLIGNPPYAGSSKKTAAQVADERDFYGSARVGALDYVAIWFAKAAAYVAGTHKSRFAFVSTSSIHHGVQAEPFWRQISQYSLEVIFAYPSFKWENNAKNRAGVNVSVIGVGHSGARSKFIESGGIRAEASEINAYLVDAPNVVIGTRRTPLTKGLPSMTYGSKPVDDGNFMLSFSDHAELLARWPESEKFVKKIVGSEEIIGSTWKFCIWIEADEVAEALSIEGIARRVEKVANFRSRSLKAATRRDASTPWKFTERRHQESACIGFPATSSELREYIPLDFFSGDAVIHNKAFAVYGEGPWLFALLSSRMHMSWTHAVAGRSPETRINYSNTIVYNNFPVPPLSDAMKERLTVAGLRVLDVREYHCEKTLGGLYDPDLMPEDLRAAHAEVDALVDSIYSKRDYETDEQRLSDLFGLYEAMTADDEAKPAKRSTK